MTRAGRGGVLLWDRSHLEAAAWGLVILPDLAEAGSCALFVRGAACETLAGCWGCGVQTARRRTSQMVTANSSIASASSQPLSIHWNGQYRLAGWYRVHSV